MSTLLATIPSSELKFRWEEPYVSDAFNKVAPAICSGIATGFWPIPGGGLTLRLDVDKVSGLSLAFPFQFSDGLSVVYRRATPVDLDLTAHAGTKVYIGITADYAVTVATTGEIRAYTEAEFIAGLVDVLVVCAVDVPMVAIVDSDIDIGWRSWRWRNSLADFYRDGELKNTISVPSYLFDLGVYPPGPKNDGTTIDVYTVIEAGSNNPRVLKFEYEAGGPVSDSRRVSALTIREGEYLILRMRRKLAGATATAAGWRIWWRDGLGNAISDEWIEPSGTSPSATTEAWTEYELSRPAPANAATVHVAVGVQGFSAGDMFVEDIYVTAESVLPKRGDGFSHMVGLGLGLLSPALTNTVARLYVDTTDALRLEYDRVLIVSSSGASNTTGIVNGSTAIYVNGGDSEIRVVGGDLVVQGADLVVQGDVDVQNELTAATATVSTVVAGVLYPGTIKELDPTDGDILVGANPYIERTIHIAPYGDISPGFDVPSHAGDGLEIAGGDTVRARFRLDLQPGTVIVNAMVYATITNAGTSISLFLDRVSLTGSEELLAGGTLTGVTGADDLTVTPGSPHTVQAGWFYSLRLHITGVGSETSIHGMTALLRYTSLAQAFGG